MTSESLLRAIGDICDELIELPARTNAGKAWVKWAITAACVCLAVSSVMLPRLADVLQPKPAIETPVVGSTGTNEGNSEPSDKSEERNIRIVRNSADEYIPNDYGEPTEVLSFDTASDTFSVFGGKLLPEVLLKQTVPDEGAAMSERPTDVFLYHDSQNKRDIYRAEYLYEGKESGAFTVTAENTSCSNIGSDEYEPNYFINNERLPSNSDSISLIGSNTALVAETDGYVFVQMIVPSPNYLNRINDSEHEVKDGVFVSYDEVPEEYILLTFCFEKQITDEQLARVLDMYWGFISNSYLSEKR